jgi:hypothetical protein
MQALDDTSTRILTVSRDAAEIRCALNHASVCSEVKISHLDVRSEVYWTSPGFRLLKISSGPALK